MPLKNIKVIELAGLAPAPFCGMVLADFGATVIRVDKIGVFQPDVLANRKKSIALNLKLKEGADIFRTMSETSDVIIDPFRKGVMEKLNLGPNELMKSNERLIYARLTGFGQHGTYSEMAGHDINFLAVSGILSLFGRSKEKPTPPINFAADFGGGGLLCALGIVLALFERSKSNLGQIIDSSMVSGVAYVGSWLFRSQGIPGLWGKPRGNNLLDSGAHFYDTYETRDGKFMAVGALEPNFYAIFLEKLHLNEDDFPQFSNFNDSKKKLSKIFKEKTQKEWCRIFDSTDACVTPVLSLKDASKHQHNILENTFTVSDEKIFPNPAPRLSRTQAKLNDFHLYNPHPGEHSREILSNYGFSEKEIDNFVSSNIVQQVIRKSKL